MTDDRLKELKKQVNNTGEYGITILAALIKADAIEEAARIQAKAIVLAGNKIQSGLEEVAKYLT